MKLIRRAIKVIFPFIVNWKRKLEMNRRLTPHKKLSFEVNLVDHCNLNCIGCSHFCPIADKNYCRVETLEQDFKRISEIANGKIGRVFLLGGEPLLHPDLLKILDIAGKYFSKFDLGIVTNGILLEKQTDEFWKSCKRNNIKIIMTRYPINLPYNKIEKLGKLHAVIVKCFDNNKDENKKMVKVKLNLTGNAKPKQSFSNCVQANVCVTLDNGKIYTCSVIPTIKYFNKQFKTDLKVCDNDYIDIYKEDSLDAILQFLSQPIPFCRYCDRPYGDCNIDWVRSKKEMSEWV